VTDVRLRGIDFTCAPGARKPITVAAGHVETGSTGTSVLVLDGIDELRSLAAFEARLADAGPWFAACDFPFGLPRVFVDELRLGATTDEVIAAVRRRCPTRMAWRAFIDAWTSTRAPGQRLVHRRTDRTPVGVSSVSSTSPLQSRYVPVAFMYYEGLHRLVQADVTIPRLRRGRRDATAVEGYPGLLAHELIGRRSYKNGDDAARRAARSGIVDRLGRGDHRLAVPLVVTRAQRRVLLDDASGDRLDAVLCLVQAAWAQPRRGAGMPRDVDPVEGWIATA
jgi:hypothetical protein